MILNKFIEKQKVEKVRNLLNGLVIIFIIMAAITYIGGLKMLGYVLDIMTFCILIVSNIYFYKVKVLYKKYTKYFSHNADWIDKNRNMANIIDKDTVDLFAYTKYNEIKRLGNSVLNDSVIVKDGYYSAISLSFITVGINMIYDLYRFTVNELSPFIFAIIVLISLFLMIPIIQNIKDIDVIKKTIKGFITDKGWDKKWKK